MTYDGFISYSHAADDLLAPRLQAGLQRFAKPWWKRRALRIFRDESSLSANPHLWSSITDALDTSGWFVLLLSPEAAQSEWVNQEIAYWVAHKDPNRIIPVLTDGEFGWDGDVTGDAVPGALLGVLSEEPRWVDLRFAKGEEQLDLQDPRFADAVAGIASAMRGVAKDELAGEEVRQHRRTVRTAWLVGVALLTLGVASLGFGLVAARNAEQAHLSAEEAERQEETALAAEVAALDEAANSEARRLGAEAVVATARDPQLAMLLSLHAISTAGTPAVLGELVEIVRNAVGANRLLARLDVPVGPTGWGQTDSNFPFRFGSFVSRAALSPDASVAYHLFRPEGVVTARPLDGSPPIWRYRSDRAELAFVHASPDGSTVVVSEFSGEGGAGRLVVLDAERGTVEAEVVPGDCPVLVPTGRGFSFDGRWFFVHAGSSDCSSTDRGAEDDWVAVVDTESWQVVETHAEPGARNEQLQLSADGRTALLAFTLPGGEPQARLVAFPTLTDDESENWTIHHPALAPDGDLIAHLRLPQDFSPGTRDRFSVGLLTGDGSPFGFSTVGNLDVVGEYGTVGRFRLIEFTQPYAFAPEGGWLAFASRRADQDSSGLDAVLDLGSGDVQLLAKEGDTYSLAWSKDGSRLLTVQDGTLQLWEIEPDPTRLNPALASQDWAGFALESALARGFAPAECATYSIDPCPLTLAEVRATYGGQP